MEEIDLFGESKPYGPKRVDSNDKDLVRKSIKTPPRPTRPDGTKDPSNDKFHGLPTLAERIRYGHPAGAPPLDWWVIDD